MPVQAQNLTIGGFFRSIWRILAGRPQIPPALAGNALLSTVLNRRSVRKFSQTEIPDDVFSAILEAGRVAPSTVNLQTWTFAVFDAAGWKARFERSIPFKAQRAVIVMADIHRNRAVIETFPQSPLVEYTVGVMNASLAAMNMNIAAEVLGVSSVMLSETGRCGLLDVGYLKEKLCLPDGVIPLTTIVFGYPASAAGPMPPKLPLDQITFSNAYQEADTELLADWMMQMKAGYKASFPFSSFNAQLEVYRSKISKAEEELTQAVFHRQD